MIYTIVWSGFAETQLAIIFDYYATNSGMEVAKKLIGKIKTSSAILESAPFIGRVEEFLKGRKVIYRYLVCGNYKIVYSVDDRDKMVRIADVFDTRQHPVKIKRKK